MRISKKELKRLIRQFPLAKNKEDVTWLLNNSELILQALYNYDRIVNLVQDEVNE